MLCAWVYPVAEKAMQYMDKQATAIEARTADVLKVRREDQQLQHLTKEQTTDKDEFAE